MDMIGLGLGEILITAFIIIFIIWLIPRIFYCLTLQNTLNEVSPENRRMSPGQVWLILIPIFGLIWQFLMVGWIADSLAAEFRSRNIQVDEQRPGYNVGLTYCILFACSYVPYLGGLAGLAGLVCWIIYWVKIANYKSQLRSTNPNNILDAKF